MSLTIICNSIRNCLPFTPYYVSLFGSFHKKWISTLHSQHRDCNSVNNFRKIESILSMKYSRFLNWRTFSSNQINSVLENFVFHGRSIYILAVKFEKYFYYFQKRTIHELFSGSSFIVVNEIINFFYVSRTVGKSGFVQFLPQALQFLLNLFLLLVLIRYVFFCVKAISWLDSRSDDAVRRRLFEKKFKTIQSTLTEIKDLFCRGEREHESRKHLTGAGDYSDDRVVYFEHVTQYSDRQRHS